MRFFGQSICLGGVIGILLDASSGLGRNQTKTYRFWLDVIFGPLAAVVMFLGSLVIMDGQLHPVLFCGAFVGLLLEHLLFGRYLAESVVILRKCVRKMTAYFGKICVRVCAFLRKMIAALSTGRRKMRKMMKKEGK